MMKAWRFHSINDMRLDKVPEPEVPPGWALIRVTVTQPSITEVIRARNLETIASNFVRRTIVEKAPVQLLGHEFCGVVAEVGEGISDLQVGSRVANACSRVPCYSCQNCHMRKYDACRKGPSIGLDIPGSFAEYVALPGEVLVSLPSEVDDSTGANMQPLTSCVALVGSSQVNMGDTVVVLGQGAMGLALTQILRASGASRVITTDVRPEAVAMSKELGADEVINARETDPVTAIFDLTHGRGADVVFEAAGGSPEVGLAGATTFEQALQVVCDSGRIVPVAMLDQSVTLDLNILRKRSIKLLFPDYAMRPATLAHALQLLASGRVRLRPAITHVLTGLESLPRAIEITGNKSYHQALYPAQLVVNSI